METVFVSSTCYDLIDLRAELEVQLRALGLRPIMSDRVSSDFVVEGRGDSVEECLVNLRKADAVIVVLSQRYGPPLPGIYGGLSATHVEYNEAVRRGKRILFYARDKLLADYATWRRDAAAKLEWVKDERQRLLFNLLEQRESSLREGQAGPDAQSNWVWPFRDVIELKDRVKKDLQREARAATLRRLLETRAIPALGLVSGGTTQSGGSCTWSCTVVNVGAGAIDALGWMEGGTKRSLGVLGPNTSSTPQSFDFGPPPQGQGAFNTQIHVEYVTGFGHRIRDTFAFKAWLTTSGLLFEYSQTTKTLLAAATFAIE